MKDYFNTNFVKHTGLFKSNRYENYAFFCPAIERSSVKNCWTKQERRYPAPHPVKQRECNHCSSYQSRRCYRYARGLGRVLVRQLRIMSISKFENYVAGVQPDVRGNRVEPTIKSCALLPLWRDCFRLKPGLFCAPGAKSVFETPARLIRQRR